MSRIELAPDLLVDLERTIEHPRLHAVPEAAIRIRGIIAAVDVLASNPLIGRLADSGNRELVIGRGAHACVALYRYVTELDAVFVLAVRGRQEAGYARE